MASLFLPYQACGQAIDCWRVFEAHWLSLNGQPQFAALQCVLQQQSSVIDTFVFKEFLLSLNQKKFLTLDNVLTFLTEKSVEAGVDAHWSRFQPGFRPPELRSLSGHFYQSATGRFLCPRSGQPFTGEVQLNLAEPLRDADALAWLLLDRRSAKFEPHEYLDSLFTAIESWELPFIISLHIARRGGISYQGIRWDKQAFIDPQSLVQLSCVE